MAVCWDLAIDGDWLAGTADIMDPSGLLSDAGAKGDLIEFDFQPGAVWQAGPRETYSFDVPVEFVGDRETALLELRALQAKVGALVTLTRRTSDAGVTRDETCQAVMVNAITVTWPTEDEQPKTAVLIFQQLDGGWT